MFDRPPVTKIDKPEKEKDSSSRNFSLGKLGKDQALMVEIVNSRLSPKDLYSVLLVLMSENSKKKTPERIFAEYAKSSLLEPSPIKKRDYLFLENALVSALDDEYDCLEFSPVAPAGLCSSVNKNDPKTMLQTIKNSELISDPSVLLAIESSKRLKGQKGEEVGRGIKLATAHRVLRMQKFANPEFTPHYNTFSISSAEVGTDRRTFNMAKTFEQVDYFLDFLTSVHGTGGFEVGGMVVEISDISIIEKLIDSGKLDRAKVAGALRSFGSMDYFSQIGLNIPRNTESLNGLTLDSEYEYLETAIRTLSEFEATFLKVLKSKYPTVRFVFRLDRSAGIGYFDGMCYKIRVDDSKGMIPIVDGGASDWAGKFSSNSKVRFYSSGIGMDVLIKKFNKKYE